MLQHIRYNNPILQYKQVYVLQNMGGGVMPTYGAVRTYINYNIVTTIYLTHQYHHSITGYDPRNSVANKHNTQTD